MKRGTAETYTVFTRDWWREPEPHERGQATQGIPNVEDGLVPYPGAPRRTIATHCTEAEARAICKEWNESHEPGRYSRKAEWGRD